MHAEASMKGTSGSACRWQHYTQSAPLPVSHPLNNHCSTATTLSVTPLIPEGKFAFHHIKRSTQVVASQSTGFLLTGTEAGRLTCCHGAAEDTGTDLISCEKG